MSAASSKKQRLDQGITAADIQTLSQLAADLSYASLNLTAIRNQVKVVTGGSATQLLKTLVGLTILGSKFTKRAQKASNPDAARSFVTGMSSLQITETRSSPLSLTGPRVLMAHAPLVLRLRELLSSEGKLGPPGVMCATPAVLCEPSLASMSGLYPEMVEFLEEFAVVLNDDAVRKNKPNKKDGDQAAVDAMHAIRLIAVANHNMDPLYKDIDVKAATIGQLLELYKYT